MSGANYEYCLVCGQKALYVGEEDVPDDVAVVHEACLERVKADAAAAERERIAQLAERVGATRTERCREPAHAQMAHAIRALGSGGGHAVPFADLLRDDVAREAEVLHAEHHPGHIVPSLDSCTEHDRARYEQKVRDMQRQDQP